MFTFPSDSNNKAGSVKPYGTNEFVVPTQEIGYAASTVKRNTLVANTNTQQDHGSIQEGFTLHNFGPGDAYVRIDAAAAVDGATSILLSEGMGYFHPVRGQVVNWIGAGTPKVQSIGVK